MSTTEPRGGRLAGKVAVVTGAGYEGELLGTGAAIAMLFARHGARTAVLDISPERAERTQAAIGADGGDATVIVADVTSTAECARAVDEIVSVYGRVDVLVNNAGIVGSGSVVDVDESVWDRVIDVNLKSVMAVSRACIPAMRANSGGSIVNISSIAGMRAFGTCAYAASKGGMIALTQDMAYSHGREGIRVNCIAPGHLHTPMGYSTDTNRELRRRAGLLDTEGTAWDVAHAALFLSSDEARWITGALLPVDAGATVVTGFAMHHHLV